MSTILQEQDYLEIKNRIQNLHPQNTRRWGKMNVYQMLFHVLDALKMMFGDISVKHKGNFISRALLKGFVLYGPKKFPKSTPTAPELVKITEPATEAEFEKYKTQIISYLDRLRSAPENAVIPHPAFGKMSKQQYGVLVYKHLDHHLRQFGA